MFVLAKQRYLYTHSTDDFPNPLFITLDRLTIEDVKKNDGPCCKQYLPKILLTPLYGILNVKLTIITSNIFDI